MTKPKYLRSGYILDGEFIYQIDVYGNVVSAFYCEDPIANDLLNIYPLGAEIVYYDEIVIKKHVLHLDINPEDLIAL